MEKFLNLGLAWQGNAEPDLVLVRTIYNVEDAAYWKETHFFRLKMSIAFNFDPIFNLKKEIKVHSSLKSFAVRTFVSSIFVLIIILVNIRKNWNFLHNNFSRFNSWLGKLYIVLNECLETHKIQITCLLFHLIVIYKFYENIGK